MSKTKNIIAGLLIGTTIGCISEKINSPMYNLNEIQDKTYLKSDKLNKKYEIIKLNNTFYLGDHEHNLEGVKEVAYHHGLMIKNEKNYQNQQENKELESMLQEQDIPIKEKVLNKIQELNDKVKLWYQDLKK